MDSWEDRLPYFVLLVALVAGTKLKESFQMELSHILY